MCVFLVFHALTRWLSARCLPTACLLELLCYIFVVSYRILLLYMHVFVVVRALSRTLSRRPPSTDRIYHLIFDFIPMDSPFISTLWLFQIFSLFFPFFFTGFFYDFLSGVRAITFVCGQMSIHCYQMIFAIALHCFYFTYMYMYIWCTVIVNKKNLFKPCFCFCLIGSHDL